jgi:hypothetical protein
MDTVQCAGLNVSEINVQADSKLMQGVSESGDFATLFFSGLATLCCIVKWVGLKLKKKI